MTRSNEKWAILILLIILAVVLLFFSGCWCHGKCTKNRSEFEESMQSRQIYLVGIPIQNRLSTIEEESEIEDSIEDLERKKMSDIKIVETIKEETEKVTDKFVKSADSLASLVTSVWAESPSRNHLFLCFVENWRDAPEAHSYYERNGKLKDHFDIAYLEIQTFSGLAKKFKVESLPAIVCLKITPCPSLPHDEDEDIAPGIENKETERAENLDTDEILGLLEKSVALEKTTPVFPLKENFGNFFARCLRRVLFEEVREKSEQESDELSLLNEVEIFLKSEPVMFLAERAGEGGELEKRLEAEGIILEKFDVNLNIEIKEAIRIVSGRGDYPQLYVNGKLIGCKKEILERLKDNSLIPLIPPKSLESNFKSELRELITKKRLVLFMKGDWSNQRCGFSRSIVELLRNHKGFRLEDLETFDVLLDEKVRQGIKKYSGWSTFPQLYVCGKLVGGLDVVRQLSEDGELESVLREGEEEEKKRQEKLRIRESNEDKVIEEEERNISLLEGEMKKREEKAKDVNIEKEFQKGTNFEESSILKNISGFE